MRDEVFGGRAEAQRYRWINRWKFIYVNMSLEFSEGIHSGVISVYVVFKAIMSLDKVSPRKRE